MGDRALFDTNILVYSIDSSHPIKMRIASDLIREYGKCDRLVLSTQVISEFYVVLTKKLKIKPLDAKAIIQPLSCFEVITISQKAINEAIDISILNKLSFWDSLVIASAQCYNISTLFTEDLNSGQIVRGVKIVNPFLESYHL